MKTAAALLLIALCCATGQAAAERNLSAHRPAAAKSAIAAARPLSTLGSTSLHLPALDPAEVEAMRAENARSGLRALKLGAVRDLASTPDAGSAALQWHAVSGGRVAQWRIVADGARALRVELSVRQAPTGMRARFAAEDDARRPMEARLPALGTLWSPVIEGDRAIVELFAPEGADTTQVSIAIAKVAQHFWSPAAAQVGAAVAKSASGGSCQMDLACVAPSDPALARAATAVSRITYVSDGYVYACTGTLLNPGDGSFTPYYYTAAHCIHDQEAASSIAALWFDAADGCGGTQARSPEQTAGGAQLLVADVGLDGALLRLNEMPPEGVVYAGWDSLPVAAGTGIVGIHHPEGGLKKVSEGAAGPYADARFVSAAWSEGATAPGSSGSGLFTAIEQPRADYLLRGTLIGGNSACTGGAPSGQDVYSRLDRMWPKLAPYLSAHAPDSNFTGLWWDPAEPGWGLSVQHQGGVIMATLFGYASSGEPRWYIASAMREQADGDFRGDLFEMSGPTFGTTPWGQAVMRNAGSMRIVFAGPAAARVEFSIDGATFAKDIVPMVFGATGRAVCSFTEGSRADAKNYQDLWWNPAESGWGLAIAHQGDVLFAVLFTYDEQHRATWIVGSEVRLRSDGSYSGELYRTRGSAFGSDEWQPAAATPVGSITLQFSDGESALLSYTIDGRTVRTPITRLVAAPSVPTCR
jgi:hypothetical protein